MQTFLPYDSFILSASCLDNKRLGKQRVECKQIYQALIQGPEVMYDTVLSMQAFGMTVTPFESTRYKKRKTAWYNHPATQMWKGYEYQFVQYALCICDTWIRRGYKDTLYDYFTLQLDKVIKTDAVMPLLGNESFHQSHQSNLVRKDPTHYRKYFPTVPSNLPYIWKV